VSPSDIREQQAREHHKAAQDAEKVAAQHRLQRDRLVHQLRSENPSYYTHIRLSKIVRCSEELIAAILRKPIPTRRSKRPKTA
jgi:hypothetical protein